MSSDISEHEMEVDEGDDLYEPEEPKIEESAPKPIIPGTEELEEGEEEDEGGAMDEDDDDSVCMRECHRPEAKCVTDDTNAGH